MNVGIYQGASALSALERWQQTVSENISASAVPGFKKNEMAFSGLNYGTIQDRASRTSRSGAQPAVMPLDSSVTTFENGPMNRTENPNDVAIGGRGFFVVSEASGNLRYTRNGEFSVNASGQLVSSLGEPVLGTGGPITLIPGGGELQIGQNGQIYQGSQLIGRLKVVDFNDTAALTKVSGGFYAPEGSQPKEMTSPNLSQGYLEGSNVSVVNEMVQLIQVSRAYEANQKAIQAYDDRLNRVTQTFSR